MFSLIFPVSDDYNQEWLTCHICSHAGEKLYKCDTCGEEFVKRRLLKNHTCSQSEEKLYKCDTCGEEFVKRRQLKNHTCSQSEEKSTNVTLVGKNL